MKQSIDSYYNEFIGPGCTDIIRAKEVCARLKEINDVSCDILEEKKRWPLWKKVLVFFDLKRSFSESDDLLKRSKELQDLLLEIIHLHIKTRH